MPPTVARCSYLSTALDGDDTIIAFPQVWKNESPPRPYDREIPYLRHDLLSLRSIKVPLAGLASLAEVGHGERPRVVPLNLLHSLPFATAHREAKCGKWTTRAGTVLRYDSGGLAGEGMVHMRSGTSRPPHA